MPASPRRAIAGALGAALLFGASTPAAKVLAGDLPAFLLAGLLYAGSGLGLALWIALRSGRGASIARADLPWLAGAVLFGGIVAPVLLMLGLAATASSTASLLLNLEGVFTALIAWFVFGENFDRRIALGMALILAAGGLAAFEPGALGGLSGGGLLVALACLAWAIDNNLTRKVSAGDPVTIAALKGLVAGAINLGIAALSAAPLPSPLQAAGAALIGLLGYGASLVLFVIALRELGAARTGAYFSTAPFAGVVLALAVLGEAPAWTFWLALPLMAAGVWLHASERHIHEHTHEPLEHAHSHVHDEHHRHEHDFDWDGAEPHAHRHRHERMVHRHPHYPDIHHRHSH
ncbi:MAG TPA: DMT family transporter [Burkholderiales bacterium]|jgi:drug/metabolite transporter (DMT)-like permease|nr:DMT family transporter [Burkholderiales bacterium]